MTHFWARADPITLEATREGVPLRFTFEGVVYTIEEISPWRVDRDWWVARLWRDYFRVITTSGQIAIIYRDFLDDTWWWQRLYD